MDSFNSPSTKPLYRGTQVVWYILGLLEAFLAFRFVLKLLGASTAAGFTRFIYSLTYIFVAPFLQVFSNPQIAGSTFEWATLLSMLFYLFVAMAVIKLFVMSKTVSTPEAAVELDKQD